MESVGLLRDGWFFNAKSHLRVTYYIYLLDCHISTVYATLPRMPVLEMQACLPSDESAFGAENAETFRGRLSSVQSAPRLSLVDVVQAFMVNDSMSPELWSLTAFPLFLAIEGRSFSAAAGVFRLICDDSPTNYDLHREDTTA